MLDIHPKISLFSFDSFGLKGFKLFVVDNDQQIINDLLFNFKKCKSKSNQKLTLCNMKFCVETWQKMPQETKNQLTETAQNLFHLLEQFAKLKKSQSMNIIILENAVQNLLSAFSVIFLQKLI